MPLYEVIEITDVWGNPVEGFEENLFHRAGELALRADASDEALVKALMRDGHLGQHALEMFRGGELQVESPGDYTEIGEIEQGWENIEEESYLGQSDVYIAQNYTAAQVAEAEDDGYTEDNYQLVTNFRPVLRVDTIYPEDGAKPFWRAKVGISMRNSDGSPGPNHPIDTAVLELRINPNDMTQKSRSGKGVFKVQTWIDDEFFGEKEFPDQFEDEDPLGLAANNEVVFADPGLVSEQSRALEAFMDKGGEAHPTFLKVKVREDAKTLFPNDRDLPRLVQEDGVRDGSEHWDHDYTAEDIQEIRRSVTSAREWATRLVDNEVPEAVFGYIESMREDGYSQAQLDVLTIWYREGVISGLTRHALAYAEQHGDAILLGEE